MKLRDVDALKTWLRETVLQISDAEPDDLAKYIVALLRKDKSERDLEDLCQKELQIFFRENTMEFLSQLFSALRTESYITEKVRKIKKESGTISPTRQDVFGSRTHPPRDDDIRPKSGLTRNDDKYSIESARSKQTRGENRDLRNRLGDVNARDYRRHRDDYERRERRKRSRSRSPFQRRRSGTSRHHQDDLRSLRLRRRSRERSRSRDRSESVSPFTQSGFRSEKYFVPSQKTPSDGKDDQTHLKRISTVHSRSSSADLRDGKDYKITEPLDDIMNCRNSTPQPGFGNKFRSIQDVCEESLMSRVPSSIPASDSSAVVMTTPQKTLPSLVTPVPPSLPMGFGIPPPNALSPFPAKLIPAAQPIQSVVSNHPPQIIQHFTAYPPPSNLVPSIPLGLNFQSPQIIISKEPTSRQVVGFANLNSFPAYVEHTSVKNRLGIKLDGHQGRYDGNLDNTLLINNIPPALNTISSINQQFSKFGTITNIQVHYSGNPGSALITFGSHSAAESAYNSSEPVFNNRFIEVLWYHDHTKISRVVLPEARRSVKERLGGVAPEPKVHIVDDKPEEERHSDDPAENEEARGSEEFTAPVKSTEQKRTVVLMPSKNPQSSCASQLSQMSFVYNPSSNVRKMSAVNKKGDLMKEVMKRKLELEKKKRLFFEEQLQKQKSILEELQKPGLSEEDRLAMKKKLKELSLQSRKLKSELDGNIELMKPENFQDSTFPSNVSAPELKKQILDAELDMISQAKDGVDTTELDKKIKMMKKQASIIFKRQTKRPFTQKFLGKPTKPFYKVQQGKAARPQYNPQMSLRLIDRRPKQLIVSGFQSEKKNAVIAHLGKFGKMEKFEDIGGKEESIIVTYATRKEAEQVARMAADFEDGKLAFAWAKTSASSYTSLTETPHESEASLLKEADGDGDDDDEDDDDSDTMIELMIEDDGTTDLVENSLIDGESLLNLR